MVAGLFDPLTETQALRLDQLMSQGDGRKQSLLIVILDADDTLLSANARAVLMAALRLVNLVSIAVGNEWRNAIPSSERIQVLEDMREERVRSAQFEEFVLRRQRGPTAGVGMDKNGG